MDVNELVSSLRGEIWGVWFLAGAVKRALRGQKTRAT